MKQFILICCVIILSACSVEKSESLSSMPYAASDSYAASISTDSSLSITSSAEEGIVVWNLAEQQPLFRWQQTDDENPALLLAVSANNSHAVSANSNRFSLWNLTQGTNEGVWSIAQNSIRDIALSNNGATILVALDNNKIIIFDKQTNTRSEFVNHQANINSIDISANGKFAISGSNDYVAFYWNVTTAEIIHRFVHTSRITKVRLHATLPLAFTTDARNNSKLWDLTDGTTISKLRADTEQNFITSVQFSESGKALLTGAADRDLALWNIASGQLRQTWKVTPRQGSRPPSAVVYATAFTDDNNVISACSNGLFEVWKIEQ